MSSRRDQVLDRQVDALRDDLGAALVAELVADRRELVADDRRDARRLGEDVEQVDDLRHHLAVFAGDLVLLESGQALQPQLEDRLRLRVGQPIALRRASAASRTPAARPSGRAASAAARFSISSTSGERHVLRHQRGLGLGRRRRRLDQRDDLVDVRQRDGEAFEDVAAVARLAQLEARAPHDDLAPVLQEELEELLEIEQARLAVDQRDHVHAEAVLQLRQLVQVVEDDLGDFAALELDDDAHAGLVRLVAQVGNAVELLLADQLADAHQQRSPCSPGREARRR